MFNRVFNRIFNNGKQISNSSKKSYSQSGEDLIVKYIFDVLGIKQPGYLDIGAHHPFYLSNTALFYEVGSRGINIEPDPVLIEAFFQYRKEDINLNIGISDKKKLADFYIINDPVLNTFSREEAENYFREGNYRIVEQKKIQVDTIQSVMVQYKKGRFPEYLSIDAEGVDEIVLRSLDYTNNFPIVICVETISFSNSGKGKKNVDLIDFIKSNGYILYADTYINSIFVRKDKWEKQ